MALLGSTMLSFGFLNIAQHPLKWVLLEAQQGSCYTRFYRFARHLPGSPGRIGTLTPVLCFQVDQDHNRPMACYEGSGGVAWPRWPWFGLFGLHEGL